MEHHASPLADPRAYSSQILWAHPAQHAHPLSPWEHVYGGPQMLAHVQPRLEVPGQRKRARGGTPSTGDAVNSGVEKRRRSPLASVSASAVAQQIAQQEITVDQRTANILRNAEKHAAEQRTAAGQLAAAERRAAEQRATVERCFAERRAADEAERHAEAAAVVVQRDTEQRAAEQHDAEQRAGEQHAAGQRAEAAAAAEQRAAEQRAAEQRAAAVTTAAAATALAASATASTGATVEWTLEGCEPGCLALLSKYLRIEHKRWSKRCEALSPLSPSDPAASLAAGTLTLTPTLLRKIETEAKELFDLGCDEVEGATRYARRTFELHTHSTLYYVLAHADFPATQHASTRARMPPMRSPAVFAHAAHLLCA